MRKKSISRIFVAILCIASAYAHANILASPEYGNKALSKKVKGFLPPYTYNLDPNIVIQQKMNEKGLVVMQGKLTKPFTTDHVKLSIKYQDAQGNWVTGWCKTLYSYNQYNENLKATFELPASAVSSYNVKIELSSDTNLTNFNSVVWGKAVSHYRLGDYAATNCDLDENEYTILLTPKKDGTLVTDANGKVTGVKDRVTSMYGWNKIGNVLMDNKKDNVVFSPVNPSTLNVDPNGAKSVKMTNSGAPADILGSTPELIYNVASGHPSPYLYTYNDPVYMFAGKFSISGLMMKFSQWPDDANGPGYHDFRNPNQLQSRYFNVYNSIQKKLSEFITDQEPVVFVSSQATGLRVYKSNGAFITLTASSNYGAAFFGYGNDQGGARRGPGSENLIISNTPEMTLYGMGALRNDATTTSQSIRSLTDIESEIAKFINYTGVFTAALGTGECSQGCFVVNPGAQPDNKVLDWTKAPNSYIFDPNQANDGLYIPIKKAYTMWQKDRFIGGPAGIPAGQVTADVLWEDDHGLIKSGTNYSLEIIGSGEDAKIKVPVNKAKKGNAVIAFKVGGEVYWSWHVWVTDNPENGSKYKSFSGLKRERKDGTVELIPDSDWGLMDRNLGALSGSMTSGDWNKNGGLLYQWGRKDPIPNLTYRGNDNYEVSGSIGRIRHRISKNMLNATKIDDLTKYVKLSNATVTNNIRLSVNNPLSLIYINKDDNSGPAFYSNNVNWPVSWFGQSSELPPARLSELNLWSDNSRGFITDGNINDDSNAAPYRDKSSYDPCPNGWRVPSMLAANLDLDNMRLDFSPFGVKTSMKKNQLDFLPNSPNSITGTYLHIIKPNDNNTLSPLKGFKVYSNIGIDMSNVGGNNMGIYPGTGAILRGYEEGQFTDQHHVELWTATMLKDNASASVSASSLFMVADKDQPDIPDSNLSGINGRFYYNPSSVATASDAIGCRCSKDPLYKINDYDFPAEFFTNGDYMEGLNNPNTYTIVKSATESIVEIPVSKAFSVQSQLLNNKDILNPSNFSDLKTNVLWSTNTNLVKQIYVNQPNPSSVGAISNSKIIVKINPNQSGNTVVTLHNGSITNPIYWSWHIWVTNSQITSKRYITDQGNCSAPNYVNYAKNSGVLDTEFMDRDLGAVEAFPTITGNTLNAEEQSGAQEQIILSGGLHYQWGRKDPIPTYNPAGGDGSYVSNGVTYVFKYKTNAVKYWTGTVAANGSITYAPLIEATYNANYIKPYNTYGNSANANVLASDKPSEKIAKVLSYSVKNPLAFLVPSTLAPYDPAPNGTGRYSNGSDWLATEPNLAADRWGRGGNKSPFDPCPEGWRIADLTLADNSANFGISPWFKKGINTSDTKPTYTDYTGTRVRIGKNYDAGVMFQNSVYSIGNYSVFAGTRGIRSVEANETPNYQSVYGKNNLISVHWTAALNSNYRGRPIGFFFQVLNNAPASNYFSAFNDNNDPYFGASCRCVKMKADGANEAGPIPRMQVTTTSTAKATNVLAKAVIEEKVAQNKLELFPNPVKSILYIKGNDKVKDYYYQVYNMSGQLVKSGKFENEQTDLSSLTTGAYLVRINNSEAVVKIIKE
ncbi:Por secretion system C-terminal sorting domain-containing protein [Chryseobacterium soldanellicola]|uniref:Por secretion system C-terminal sorting domain-containing protein n=1 Tax=Chryseobacterium soldanellicola TaxID=311333 RepID=A0A1H1BPK5_9FLAO|nr:T9SS type A sorting domain-containing protein [Chryseobacterium soldanellicola]SDQ53326.1 Por secretion system C-terminal sorting domain-containing protein [Chryseobacterium soldanellicola]